jgi:hypothetical protein
VVIRMDASLSCQSWVDCFEALHVPAIWKALPAKCDVVQQGPHPDIDLAQTSPASPTEECADRVPSTRE